MPVLASMSFSQLAQMQFCALSCLDRLSWKTKSLSDRLYLFFCNMSTNEMADTLRQASGGLKHKVNIAGSMLFKLLHMH